MPNLVYRLVLLDPLGNGGRRGLLRGWITLTRDSHARGVGHVRGAVVLRGGSDDEEGKLFGTARDDEQVLELLLCCG